LIELRRTEVKDLTTIHEIGNQEHAQPFLSIKSIADLKTEFTDENTTYLSIINTTDDVLGYFVLIKNQEQYSIQLKRILICMDSLGIGQNALLKLEDYCISVLGVKRIWLDVYDDNNKAVHIYEKLGYGVFDTVIYDNRKVLYYHKSL